MPLLARKQQSGCGCRQLTIDLSPFKILTMLVDFRSQKKMLPSSLPAMINRFSLIKRKQTSVQVQGSGSLFTIYLPKKLASLMSVVVLQWPQNLSLKSMDFVLNFASGGGWSALFFVVFPFSLVSMASSPSPSPSLCSSSVSSGSLDSSDS